MQVALRVFMLIIVVLKDVSCISKMECMNLLMFSTANPLARASRKEFNSSTSLLLPALYSWSNTKILSHIRLLLEKKQRKRSCSGWICCSRAYEAPVTSQCVPTCGEQYISCPCHRVASHVLMLPTLTDGREELRIGLLGKLPLCLGGADTAALGTPSVRCYL